MHGADQLKQYSPPSSEQGILSREFAKRAHPQSVWFRRLIYYVANVDYTLMRRDAKRVAEWDVERIIPCHGDVIEQKCDRAWREAYQWYLERDPDSGVVTRLRAPFVKLMRLIFLM